jgi:methyltransferase
MVAESEVMFAALVVLVAAQRLWELAKSAEHEAKLRARGGVEHAPHQMWWMRLVHTGWLVAMPLEVMFFDRPFVLPVAIVASVIFIAGQLLRLSAMRALGERWTVKIMTVPGATLVDSGPFRHLRHPNYLGVILEIAALPLIHGAWLTALVFTFANGLLLRARVEAEDRALVQSIRLPSPRLVYVGGVQ